MQKFEGSCGDAGKDKKTCGCVGEKWSQSKWEDLNVCRTRSGWRGKSWNFKDEEKVTQFSLFRLFSINFSAVSCDCCQSLRILGNGCQCLSSLSTSIPATVHPQLPAHSSRSTFSQPTTIQ
jgi:hypothetical protein